MLNLILSLALQVSSASASVTHCETVGPRLDGITVLICDGSVKSMTDSNGNTVSYPSN